MRQPAPLLQLKYRFSMMLPYNKNATFCSNNQQFAKKVSRMPGSCAAWTRNNPPSVPSNIRLSDTMKQVMRFFWWCCGADRDTLAQYPAEHNKYMSIGATVFFTGLFAGLSGGYACYFVFSGSPGAWFYAPLFGLLWGLAIFNLD